MLIWITLGIAFLASGIGAAIDADSAEPVLSHQSAFDQIHWTSQDADSAIVVEVDSDSFMRPNWPPPGSPPPATNTIYQHLKDIPE